MVKPQFEVGKDRIERGGVVSDPALWPEAVLTWSSHAATHGLGLVDATPSDLPGPAGNREFFVHLNREGPHNRDAIERAVAEASRDRSHVEIAKVSFVVHPTKPEAARMRVEIEEVLAPRGITCRRRISRPRAGSWVVTARCSTPHMWLTRRSAPCSASISVISAICPRSTRGGVGRAPTSARRRLPARATDDARLPGHERRP